MFGNRSNIVTVFMIAALAISLTLSSSHPRMNLIFWLLVAAFVAHLVFYVRGQKKLSQRQARRLAEARHFFLPTDSLLDRPRLTRNFDNLTRRLLKGLVNTGPQDGRALRPGLERLLPRLRRLARRYPQDPGPPAYGGWALALLSRVAAKELLDESGLERPEHKLWNQALARYERAAALDPEEVSLQLDWARRLEDRAEALAETDDDDFELILTLALARYEKAAELAPLEEEAWRGRGRVLTRLAQDAGRLKALELLTRAGESYQRLTPGQPASAARLMEHGQTLFSLAQITDENERAASCCLQAADLFLEAAEKSAAPAEALFSAARAYAQAAAAGGEDEAAGRHRQALELFSQAAALDDRDIPSRLGAARSLTALFQAENSAGRPDENLLRQAAGFCAQAEAISPLEEVLSDWANILSVMAENGGERARELWAETARKYEAAAACANVPADRAAVNWHNWAYALSSLAEFSGSMARRRKLLRDVARKYEVAAGLNGDNLVTLKNLGDVLAELAELEEDPAEAAALYDQAVDKYRLATRLYPDKAGPWRRWSAVLQDHARLEQNPRRRRELWQAALDKLEKAVKAEPGDPLTWVIWGRVLDELYWEGPEYERPLVVAAAMEKYEKALQLAPRDDETWNLLGRSRLDAAEMPEELAVGGGALANTRLAVDHFKTAAGLNPDEPAHWAEWGRALFKLSQIVDNEASALAALAEAEEKYLTAVALNPTDGEHRTGLGHILYQWGDRLEEADQKRVKFQKAYQHCREAGRLAPHDPTVWRNWAVAAEALAALEKDPQISWGWQIEADEKNYRADSLETTETRPKRH